MQKGKLGLKKVSNHFKFLFVILILTLCIFNFPSKVLAATDLGFASLSPASPFYFLQTIKEGFELKFSSASKKIFKNLDFASTRLKEVNSLANTPSEDLIVPVLLRYQSNLNFVPDHGLSANESTRIEKGLRLQMQDLQDVYDLVRNSRAKRSVRAAVYALTRRLDLQSDAKKSGCQFLSTAAADLDNSEKLSSTEKLILSQRAQQCLNSLKSS